MILVERERTAIHEAGHACVAMASGIGVERASVIPSNGRSGHVICLDLSDTSLTDRIAYYAAGAVAEAIAEHRSIDNIDWHCGRFALDVERAATAMARSGYQALESPIFAAAARSAAAVISARLEDVERLALELQVHGEMSGVQVRRSLARREESRERARQEARTAFRISPQGRARESANFAAWVRAGRPQVPTAYHVDWWNAGVRVVDASGRRHVVFVPPFPIH